MKVERDSVCVCVCKSQNQLGEFFFCLFLIEIENEVENFENMSTKAILLQCLKNIVWYFTVFEYIIMY